MKIRNKGELQKIENNLSWDTGFQEFMNLYEKCTTKPYSLLVINTTLAWGSPLPFRENYLESMNNEWIT